MKRKKRDFSPRERRLIDGFIKDICVHRAPPGDQGSAPVRVGGISLSLPGRPLRVLRGRHFGLEKGLPYHSGGPPSGETRPRFLAL